MVLSSISPGSALASPGQQGARCSPKPPDKQPRFSHAVGAAAQLSCAFHEQLQTLLGSGSSNARRVLQPPSCRQNVDAQGLWHRSSNQALRRVCGALRSASWQQDTAMRGQGLQSNIKQRNPFAHPRLLLPRSPSGRAAASASSAWHMPGWASIHGIETKPMSDPAEAPKPNANPPRRHIFSEPCRRTRAHVRPSNFASLVRGQWLRQARKELQRNNRGPTYQNLTPQIWTPNWQAACTDFPWNWKIL